MKISYITIDRIVTEHRPRKNSRIVLTDARELSEQKLLEKSESLGVLRAVSS